MNRLTLYWITTTVQLRGTQQVESLGFCVDDQPLPQWLRWVAGEQLGEKPLAGKLSRFARCFQKAYVRTAYREILGLERSSLPDGRTQLYTCPCGDPFCGGLFVEISRSGAHVTWADFGNIESTYAHMPALRFDWSEYKAAVSAARGLFI